MEKRNARLPRLRQFRSFNGSGERLYSRIFFISNGTTRALLLLFFLFYLAESNVKKKCRVILIKITYSIEHLISRIGISARLIVRSY